MQDTKEQKGSKKNSYKNLLVISEYLSMCMHVYG